MRALVLACALMFGVACTTLSLPDGATAEHVYFASVADYNQAKRVAAKYAVEITTPRSHIEGILEIVSESDAIVHAFEKIRRGECADPKVAAVLPDLAVACVVTDADFNNHAGALRASSAALRALLLKDQR